ncbi:MAG TPA: hypothetical protein VJ083_03685 [Sedimentibacter sp.]|nr:hypothetical protein [Sedimentibacter sp.]
MFRILKAEEIECRVATINEKGCMLLLYKDARVDANILDETVGAMNWQRHHTRDNANCIVSIWDKEKSQWIEKEDTGKESFTEKEKGLASDSFKRACFVWGIGRELYTAPFVWINASDFIMKENKGKKITYDDFQVKNIEVTNGVITGLSIINASNKNKEVFLMGKQTTQAPLVQKLTKKQVDVMLKMFEEQKRDPLKLLSGKKIEELSIEQYGIVMEKLKR